MKTKLELATVVRQLQTSKMSPDDRKRLLQKATAAVGEDQLIAVQEEAFKLQGGVVGAKQNKLARVADTR